MIIRSLSIHLFLLLLSGTLNAQNWTGAVNDEWNNSSNWDSWPLNGENITIDPSNYMGAMASPVITTASMFVPDRLFVEGAAILTINASLTVADRTIVAGPSSVVMGGGTFNCDRCIVEGGGTFLLVDGNIVLTNRLAIGDGDVNGGSLFSQIGGSVIINGELGFECELGIFDPVYELTVGTLVVNGDVVWFGASPGSGTPRLIVNGGSVQVNGSVVNSPASTVDLFISLISGSIMTNGPDIQLAHSTDSIIQTDGILRVDNDALIDNAGIWQANGGILYVDQQAELRGNGSFQFHDLTISQGAVLQHSDPSEISVSGDWINSGMFNPDVNSVSFNGNGYQTVGSTTFHGLRVNNSGAGISLAGPSTISGDLVLDNGMIHTQMNDLLTLLDNATATSGSPVSFVEGPFRKIGNDAFVFPIGKNGRWSRTGISAMNDQNTEFTAEYFDVGYPNTNSISTALSSVSGVEHWSLTRSGSTEGTQVKLFWEDASISGISDCSTLTLARWNGTSWDAETSTISGSCTGTDPGSVESDAVLTNFNTFTFGTVTGMIGILETGTIIQVHAYPQPADLWANIQCMPNMELEFTDALGRQVYIPITRTQNGSILNTSALSSGSYSVLISSKGALVARSWILVVH